MKSTSVIPVFIPEKACPFRCIYCNQYSITQQSHSANFTEIEEHIKLYMDTIPAGREKRIAFFGGSFTGMPLSEQDEYLALAKPYLDSGQISGIQLSTRPDYISEKIVENLKSKGVTIIELGAQSFFDDVLEASRRGCHAEDIYKAVEIIRQFNIETGLQMMVGLPRDSKEKTLTTAIKIAELGVKYARIYPVLVIRDTLLEKWYHDNTYSPLSLHEAIDWCKEPLKYLIEKEITVLKCGLHPSEGFIDGTDLIAGPFHPSFKELVMTEIWHDIFKESIEEIPRKSNNTIEIAVSKNNFNFAVGYKKRNKEFLSRFFRKITFLINNDLKRFEYTIKR